MSATISHPSKKASTAHIDKVSELLDINSLHHESMLASVALNTELPKNDEEPEPESPPQLEIKRVLSFQKVDVPTPMTSSISTLSQQLEVRRASIGVHPPGLRTSMSTGIYKDPDAPLTPDQHLVQDPFVIPGLGIVDMDLTPQVDTTLRCTVYLPMLPRAGDKLPFFVQLAPPPDCTARQLMMLSRQQFHLDLCRLRVRAPQVVDVELAKLIHANMQLRTTRDGSRSVSDNVATPTRRRRALNTTTPNTNNSNSNPVASLGSDFDRSNSASSTKSETAIDTPRKGSGSTKKRGSMIVTKNSHRECVLEAGFLLEDIFTDNLTDYQLVVWSENDCEVDTNVPPLPAFARISTSGFDTFALQKIPPNPRGGRDRHRLGPMDDDDEDDDDGMMGMGGSNRCRTSSHVPPRPPAHLSLGATTSDDQHTVPPSLWARIKKKVLCCVSDQERIVTPQNTYTYDTNAPMRMPEYMFDQTAHDQRRDRYSNRYGSKLQNESEDDDVDIADLGLPIATDAQIELSKM